MSVKFYGGCRDGAEFEHYVFDAPEGEIHWVRAPNEPRFKDGYRRTGDRFDFVERMQILNFVGGPYDGSDYPAKECKVPEGEGFILVQGDQYLWYTRKGADLIFKNKGPLADLEVLDDELPKPPPDLPPLVVPSEARG